MLYAPPSSSFSVHSYDNTISVSGQLAALATTPTIIPPLELQRRGNGKYVVWDPNQRDIFKAWFEKTPYFQERTAHRKGSINWGSEQRKPGQDTPWLYFTEAACTQTGTPYIICNRCQKFMGHPAAGNGNATMRRHLETAGCLKRQPENPKFQSSLMDHVKRQVCIYP
jgi:hypothetical protein